MSPVKTGFITSLQSILPAPWGRSCIYHTSVECTAGAQYREVSAREARVSNMNNGDEGIIVQGHGFMLDLTWQQSRSNEFLLSSALTFDYLPFHGLPGQPCPPVPLLAVLLPRPPAVFQLGKFSLTVRSCMELGPHDALTCSNWADLIVSRARKDFLTPHSALPALIYYYPRSTCDSWQASSAAEDWFSQEFEAI